jgi:hypothetical protein
MPALHQHWKKWWLTFAIPYSCDLWMAVLAKEGQNFVGLALIMVDFVR